MPLEGIDGPLPHHAGRTAAWLAKQVELGLSEVDLSLPQYRVLWLLDLGPEQSSALAHRLAVRPPSVTAVVDGLVAKQMVERRSTPDDRRRVSHVLTDEGRRALNAADEAVDRRLCDIASCLPTARQRKTAIDSIALWQQAMVEHRERAVNEGAR